MQGSGLMIIYIVVIIAVMYFVMIRPQKKKQKDEQKMRESIQIGDELVTIGGIFGKVVSIKDDSIVIESVADHSKIKITKWAVSQNLTIHEEAAIEGEGKKSFFKK
ncbi:MAG: preprotein translocase subunit YajC [Acutalibacteraceae bacterium]|nr:preprotein translocase subunit YajC [Acutalibacteraceae bacterium]